jgi:mycofactocin system glycosyltransferase
VTGAATGLPDGFEVRIRGDVRVVDQGRVLVGGSPTRVARLTAAGAALVREQHVVVRDEATRTLADRLLEGNLAVPDLRSADRVEPDDLTVVVPVYERAEELDRLLGRLRPELAVVVVDDGSLAGVAVERIARAHGAQLVVLPHNRGPAAARNAGLRLARTPYVALVDSDVSADPATLVGLCSHFADPRVAAVAPRVRGVTRSGHPGWFQRYDEVAQSLDLGARQALVRPWSEVSWLPAACLLVRRSAVCGELEGFDEGLRVAEDVDLVWRLVGRGLRVRYDADFTVGHESRATLVSWLGRKAYYGTGGALLAQRHGAQVAPAVVSPVYAAAAVALLAQRRWSAPAALLAAGVTAVRLRGALPLRSGAGLEAARLAALGLVSAVSQTAQLVLRHWWPAAAVAALCSRRSRRAVLAAVLVDALVTPCPPELSRPEALLARRLDDLAYGSGLWYGALAARSTKALRIRVVTKGRSTT